MIVEFREGSGIDEVSIDEDVVVDEGLWHVWRLHMVVF